MNTPMHLLTVAALLATSHPLLATELTVDLPTTPTHDSATSSSPMLLAQAAPGSVEKPARKPDIHYVPTPEDVVEEMLTLTNVTKDDLIYDLGSGDGRIVITAAKKRGARGIGIDIDPQRISEARENAKKAQVEDRVKFVLGDLFESDFKDASVITLYLLTSLNQKVRPKILAETRPGTRVASHAFSMGPWEADQHKVLNGRSVFYWVVPANVSGRWKVNGKGLGNVEAITFEQKFQKLSGTVQRGGQAQEITDGKVTGEKFEVTVGGTEPLKITGQLKGDRIEGVGAAWTADREPGTMRSLEEAAAEKAR